MRDVYWIEQEYADVAPGNDWLSSNEVALLNSLRFTKRRDEWRLGRWTAKCAFSTLMDLTPTASSRIEVRTLSTGAPTLLWDNQSTPFSISISHRQGRAACAISRSPATIGCDLEVIEPRSDAFVADYFTLKEQEMLGSLFQPDRDLNIAVFWSAKESALKALGEGLRLDTRCVVVDALVPDPCSHAQRVGLKSAQSPSWIPLQVSRVDGGEFFGWWKQNETFVSTMVVNPPSAEPLPIHVRHHEWRQVPLVS